VGKVFVGHDWSEDHHDVFVEDAGGQRLASGRLAEGPAAVSEFHAMVASHIEGPGDVVIASETDRGLFIWALVASGYVVLAVNPKSTSRYRDRRSTSGAKSDAGDARVLAELARLDGHNHRQVAGDSAEVEAIKVLARAHQNMIWSRQRHTNMLRSTLREFYPAALGAFGKDLASGEAIEVLAMASTPALGRQLSRAKIAAALARGGRQRRIDERAVEIQAALRGEVLEAPGPISEAMGSSAAALIAVIAELNAQITRLEVELAQGFEQHPDAEIVTSMPGLATVLGSRVLGEFGDDPNRYATAKSRKNYAGTAPITRSSGAFEVVLARYSCNSRLLNACQLWALAALRASPGARAYYDKRRADGKTHQVALRAVANRLVGILHGCLRHHTLYDENIAWAHHHNRAEAA
jgi:transposase